MQYLSLFSGLSNTMVILKNITDVKWYNLGNHMEYLLCNAPTKSKYCSNKCKCKHYYHSHKSTQNKKTYPKLKTRRKNHKKQLVELHGGKCTICGYNKCIEALSFHHVNPLDKKINISDPSTSWNRKLIESKKCQLLCIRCHFELEAILAVQSDSESTNPNRYSLNRIRATERKQSLIKAKGGKCQVCGYDQCLRCMSFHHRNPELKKFKLDLRHIGNMSMELIQEEVSKCDLLCIRCHFELESQIRMGTEGLEPPTLKL